VPAFVFGRLMGLLGKTVQFSDGVEPSENQNADVGSIGLRYKTGFLFLGTEQLQADLCRSCGSIVRLFVKDTKRNWVQ
jgi:hypothetical protein